MLRILWNSQSAMNAEQDKLDAISNNIANSTTAGYKRETVGFEDLVYETLNRTGYPNNGNNPKEPINGTGVKSTEWIRDTSEGTIQATGISTDLAIEGDGYFRVTLSDGTKAYERAGSFNIDSTGTIVDKNGNKLDIVMTEEGSELKNSGTFLTPENFNVSPDGSIYLNEDNRSILYGKINLYVPVGQTAFRSIGDNLYKPVDGAQILTSNAKIQQGALEGSNVDMSTEMTDLIVAQRAFEIASKGVQTADEMWQLVNNMKSR
ncbi:flagellar basal body rod protein FlgG [Clostridium fermenticellae]|uniref:Flagellar basal body rod protein FlgG n=1 Tax=Clostridium fermenticellae TaxID=2068654 RepID=A0A386H4X0_9CLOT|nr:flagellar hook-basal body complex protein [Clostridium fermenticellae]AYD40664.1 flagellar basal body rod protein FlgG [Clostridium fermenticellae]